MGLVINSKTPQKISIGGKAVASISINGEAVWPDIPDYLYVENTYNGQNTIKVVATSAGPTGAEYSKDGINWVTLVFNTFPKTINITLNQGERVYFRSSNGWSKDVNGVRLQSTETSIAGGDLRTILNYTDVNSVTSIGTYDINCLFKSGNGMSGSIWSKLTDISNVKLGTITSSVGYRAFEDFCWNCRYLEKGLDLSTFTTPYSHSNAGTFKLMYYECRSLVEAWAPNVQSWTSSQFTSWMYNINTSGQLHAPAGLSIPAGDYGLPTNWTQISY